ncbi:hypothetical protein Tco_0967037 [Tanacetum coccineum]
MPERSLIPPSGEVNADDTADKSLSRAYEQPVTQPKTPTDLKTKKKRILSSSQPKSPYKVRVILPKKQVAETQHAEVTLSTADATKSLEASELAEEQVNQPSAVETKKSDTERLKTSNVDSENSKLCWIIPSVHEIEQLLDEVNKQNKAVQETLKSPYDTESEIKVVKSFFNSHIPKPQDQIMHDFEESANIQEDSDYELMPEDDLRSQNLKLLILTINKEIMCLTLITFSKMIMLPLNV